MGEITKSDKRSERPEKTPVEKLLSAMEISNVTSGVPPRNLSIIRRKYKGQMHIQKDWNKILKADGLLNS